ncbi:glycosyltransferase family 2 protein [Campylobacter jejuni]|nr:glycosyltransferase family 2 protein [Campylobacter jejuni]ELD8657634.1 glycosyltransferase family 2 protein [Campylobacter jejuni]
MPQLSIIIPLFNSCDFISRALQSCINQTLKDIEILIIDNMRFYLKSFTKLYKSDFKRY